jgi:hypothetical protein
LFYCTRARLNKVENEYNNAEEQLDFRFLAISFDMLVYTVHRLSAYKIYGTEESILSSLVGQKTEIYWA